MTIREAMDSVSVKEPLFSAMMMALKPVETTEYPTLGTDGEYLFYNPDFLKTLNNEETCAVTLHEVLHCAHQHIWRRENRDPMRWNMATDYAINILVNESFKLPKGTLLDMKYYGMSSEEIYDSLPKPKPQKGGQGDKSQKGGKGNGQKQQSWCDKQSWEGQEKEEGTGEGEGKDKKDGDGEGEGILDKISKALGNKPKKESKPLPKSTMSEAEKEEKWKRLFKKSFVDNYGKLPDSIKRIVEKTFYIPVLDWASLVANLLSEDVTDYTFSQPDRRSLDSDFIMPDLYSYDRLKDVVFAYDTSGSISNSDLRSFYMETLNLFNNFSSLLGWIAICDADLHHFSEVSPQQSFEDFHFYGGGGTDFRPVFNEIAKRSIKPKALFYFTDTYGSYPSEDPGYPVFWLVKSEIGDNSRLNVPFGEVIRFLPRTE